jgi:hypothetical protein
VKLGVGARMEHPGKFTQQAVHIWSSLTNTDRSFSGLHVPRHRR